MSTKSPRDEAVEHVDFRGERWFVADARFDADETGATRGHYHLTLTAPHPIPKPRRCKVGHTDRIQGCRYCAAEFVAAVAELLGVEPPKTTRRLLNG